MPVKGNSFKSNSFKQEAEPSRGGQKQTTNKAPRAKVDILPTLDFQNGRLIKIVGLFFVILSLYFLVAFTSYLFTWQEDMSYVIDKNGGWSNLFKTTSELKNNGVDAPDIQNWLGKVGALLSHQFIYEWFGIASFLFAFVFFVIGYRLLFKVKIFGIEKVLGYSLFFLLFLSLTFGFAHSFFSDQPYFVEGEFGFFTNQLLIAQIGQAGVGGLIVFLGLSILIIAYNIDFKIPERKKEVYLDNEVPDYVNDIREEAAKNKIVEEEPTGPVEFSINDRYKNEPKKDQNIVLTPNRFEEKTERVEDVIAAPLATNVMLTPTVTAAAAAPVRPRP